MLDKKKEIFYNHYQSLVMTNQINIKKNGVFSKKYVFF